MIDSIHERRVIIVDNNESLSMDLANILTEQNFVVNIATNGMKALKLIEDIRYNIMLIDIDIPSFSAIHLCDRFRTLFPAGIIILFCNEYEKISERNLFKACSDYFLLKPFNYSELILLLRESIFNG